VRCDHEALQEAANGFSYLEAPVPPDALRLVLSDISPVSDGAAERWGQDYGI
jgi:hypothetical protein